MSWSAPLLAATMVWIAGTALVLWLGLRAVRDCEQMRVLGILGLALVGLLAPVEVGLAVVMRSYLPDGPAGQVVTDWAAVHQWVGFGALVLGCGVLFAFARIGRAPTAGWLGGAGAVLAVIGLAVRNLL